MTKQKLKYPISNKDFGYGFRCTKYFLQILSGAKAVMKLRHDFIAGPPVKLLANEMFEVEEEKNLSIEQNFWICTAITAKCIVSNVLI